MILTTHNIHGRITPSPVVPQLLHIRSTILNLPSALSSGSSKSPRSSKSGSRILEGRWFNAYDLSLVIERIKSPVGRGARGADEDTGGCFMSSLSTRLVGGSQQKVSNEIAESFFFYRKPSHTPLLLFLPPHLPLPILLLPIRTITPPMP